MNLEWKQRGQGLKFMSMKGNEDVIHNFQTILYQTEKPAVDMRCMSISLQAGISSSCSSFPAWDLNYQ